MKIEYKLEFDSDDVKQALQEIARKVLPEIPGYDIRIVSGHIPYMSVTFAMKTVPTEDEA